jgi:hypothetical protein
MKFSSRIKIISYFKSHPAQIDSVIDRVLCPNSAGTRPADKATITNDALNDS